MPTVAIEVVEVTLAAVSRVDEAGFGGKVWERRDGPGEGSSRGQVVSGRVPGGWSPSLGVRAAVKPRFAAS